MDLVLETILATIEAPLCCDVLYVVNVDVGDLTVPLSSADPR